MGAADANGAWSAWYSYDGFGNLLAKGGANAPQLQQVIDPQTNRPFNCCDANGNSNEMGWDVENRLVRTGQHGQRYDPWGKRVMKKTLVMGTDQRREYYFCGVSGQRLISVKCNYLNGVASPQCELADRQVYFAGKLVYSGYLPVVTDRLGSVR